MVRWLSQRVFRAGQRRHGKGRISDGMEARCFKNLRSTTMDTGNTSSAQQVVTSVLVAATLSTLVIGGALLTTLGA
jgi:hypothetical protein